MSLICETIVSEDELSQTQSNQSLANQSDEELDYEEDIHNNDKTTEERNESDKDEGELDDDDDLEEGEVKEEDDDNDTGGGQTDLRKRVSAPDGQPERQNSVCRFYGRGQCTWGNNCRFVHPPGAAPVKRLMPLPPTPLPMPPNLPPHMAPPPPTRSRPPHREFYDQQQTPSGGGGGNESAWERGLKQAKEMIVRATRRKEEEQDFEDKRFNLGVEESGGGVQGRRDERSSHSPERYDDEYERRRRLAFESAPWNNEEPVGARLRAAETYRDPWRRSKSPTAPGGGGGGGKVVRRPPPLDAKRSHSMSSISASGSESSEFSGSEGSSFSESSGSERSGGGRQRQRRFNRKTSEKKGAVTAPNWSKTETNAREYDSWSESLSDSDSMSSYYSEEEVDQTKDKDKDQTKRIPKRVNKSVSRAEPAPKKAKVMAPGVGVVNKQQTTDSSVSQQKKSPIKMMFTKKHPTLKKDNSVAVKLNGGRMGSAAEEPIEDEEEVSLGGVEGVSPKPISSVSPVSPPEVFSSPRPPPAQSSSSSSGSSSKYEKSLSATVSRREELLQQLKAVEDAIARKRSKIN